MYYRIAICLGLSLIVIAGYGLSPKEISSSRQMPHLELEVTTQQLSAENGVIPVELRCDKAELSSPNSVKKLSCVIKNNTYKPIVAGAVFTSMSLRGNNESFNSSNYGTFDTFLNSDFRETHKNNLILPGGEYTYSDLAVSYDPGVTIVRITMAIDYVEFADHTSVGNNRAGARIISETRTGAAQYKNWLAQKYQQKKSLPELIKILEQEGIPEGLTFQSESAEHGANMYRNFARRTYKTAGAEALIQQLKHTSTSPSE